MYGIIKHINISLESDHCYKHLSRKEEVFVKTSDHSCMTLSRPSLL